MVIRMKAKKSRYWFDNVQVIGEMPPQKVAEKLREIGDTKSADIIEQNISNLYKGTKKLKSTRTRAKSVPSQRGDTHLTKRGAAVEAYALTEKDKDFTGVLGLIFGTVAPWQHTSHAFGYIPPASAARNGLIDIKHAGAISPDQSLIGKRVNIKLDQLRVAKYPGSGMHQILFDFYAQNKVEDRVEDFHFNQTCEAQEGERVGNINYTIFRGLQVAEEGLDFRCATVNVKNENDEAILKFLSSDVFKKGLQLATIAQPAILPLSGISIGLTEMLANRNKNVMVQKFQMGLDFSEVSTGARLAIGSYVVVQIPEKDRVIWDWNEWAYNTVNGQIVNKADQKQLIPYNYIVFAVSKYSGN